MRKYTVLAQVTDYRSVTVSANSESEAVEKASKRLEKQGADPISFRVIAP